MPKKKLPYFIAGGIILVVVIAAAGKMISSANAQEANATPSIKETTVNVVIAKKSAVESNTSFSASLEASEEGMVSAKTPGKIVQVFFENGKSVSQGEVLAKLDETDIQNNIKTSQAQLNAAKSQLASSQVGLQKIQANLENTQRSYDRTKAMYDEQIISKADLENAELALKVALADMESAKAGIDAQKANLQTAETNLSILNDSLKNTSITAPIGGVMSGKNIAIGQYINTGTVIGTVQNATPIYAVIDVGESDLSYVKKGAAASFQLSGSDEAKYSGTVEIVGGTADPVSRRFECKVKLENPKGTLKPGVFGNIKVATNENKQVISLPVKSLGGNEGSYYVFLNENGSAKKQTVTVGNIFQDSVEITSGVEEGNSIVCTNVGTLQDGDAIQAKTE
jgi:RND family efflux transporter MFP subunit